MTDTVREDVSVASSAGSRRVHHEEHVSKSLGDLHRFHWVVGLFAALLVLVALWFGVTAGSLPALGIAAAVMVLVVWVLFAAIGRGVRVRVTDGHLEVRPTGVRLTGGDRVTVPLEDVSRVQYNDPDGRYIYPQQEERLDGAEWFRVAADGNNSDLTTFHDGVRVERTTGPPVYVGSVRHVELAEAIADGAPAVERAEQYSPSGGAGA